MCPGSSGVEQRIENPRVGGSNPPPGTIKKNDPPAGRFFMVSVGTVRTTVRPEH